MRYYGISAYAGMHPKFPVKKFLKQFPEELKQPAIAILLGCFGWDFKLIREFCAQAGDRKHLIEFHVSNGASRRSGRLGPGAFARTMSRQEFNDAWERGGTPALLKQLDKFLTKLRMGVEQNCNDRTRIVFSPELEDNLSDKAYATFAAAIMSVWPFVNLVRSPCTGGTKLGPARHRERHGNSPLANLDIGNLDGVSVDFGDSEKYFNQISLNATRNYLKESRAHATLLWSANQQGVGKASSWSHGWPPHKARKFVVTPQAIKGMRKLLRDF